MTESGGATGGLEKRLWRYECCYVRGDYRHPSRRLNGGCEDEYVSQSFVAVAAVVAAPVALVRYARTIVHALCLGSASLRRTLRPLPYRIGKTW